MKLRTYATFAAASVLLAGAAVATPASDARPGPPLEVCAEFGRQFAQTSRGTTMPDGASARQFSAPRLERRSEQLRLREPEDRRERADLLRRELELERLRRDLEHEQARSGRKSLTVDDEIETGQRSRNVRLHDRLLDTKRQQLDLEQEKLGRIAPYQHRNAR